MRKFILSVLLMAAATTAAVAQTEAGTKGIGVAASYGTEISSMGIGGEIQYNYSNPVRYRLGADYFFKADYTTMWDVNLNLNYLFQVAPKITIYPILGVTYTNWKFDYEGLTKDLGDWFDNFELGQYNTDGATKHVSRVGANVGIGGEYFIVPNIALNFDLKYQFIKDFNQVVFSVGATYRFK